MTTRRPLLPTLVLAAAAASLPCTAAWAAVQSSAQLYDLRVTLTDLDPLDGFTPLISFSPDAFTVPLVRASTDVPLFDTASPGLFAPLEADITTATARAAARVTAATFETDGSFRGAGMQVSTRASDSGPTAFASPEAFITAPDFTGGLSFTLSPNTRASFTALASTSVEAGFGASSQSGSATASLFVVGADRQSQFETDVAYSWLPDSDAPGRDATSRALQVNFVNATGGLLGGDFQAVVRADSFTGVAAPVPEPSTWALMLLGALGVAGAVRRRDRSPAWSGAAGAATPA